MKESTSIIISIINADSDQHLVDELEKRLRPFINNGILQLWNSRNIAPGENLEEVAVRILSKSDYILFWITPDLWDKNEIFDHIQYNIALKNTQSRILPVLARKTTAWDTIDLFQTGDGMLLPKTGGVLPIGNSRLEDEWYDNLVKDILITTGLKDNDQQRIIPKHWYYKLGFLGIIVVFLFFWIYPSFTTRDEPVNSVVGSADCVFPKQPNKDSFYIIVTRFSALEGDKDTRWYGMSIGKRIEYLSKQNSLPIKFCYRDDLFPAQEEDALKDLSETNADLIIWGNLINASNDCKADGFCFQYTVSDQVKALGGNALKASINPYQENITAKSIIQGLMPVGESLFDDWLIGLYNLKVGNAKPDLFVINEIWPSEKKMESYKSRGLAYFKLGFIDKAEADFERARHINRNDHQVLSFLALVEGERRNYEKAIDYCTKAIDLEPGNATLYYYKSYYYSMIAWEKQNYLSQIVLPDFLKDIAVLQISVNTKSIDSVALININIAIEINPEEEHFIEKRAEIYAALTLLDSAENEYNLLVEKHNQSAVAYASRGGFMLRQNRYRDALTDFSKAVSLDRTIPEYFAKMAICYQQLKKRDSVDIYMNMALQMAPQDVGILKTAAECYERLYDFETSAKYYELISKYDSSLLWICTNRVAEHLNKLKKYKKTISIASGVIDGNKDPIASVDIRYQRALAYSALGKYEKTETDLDTIIDVMRFLQAKAQFVFQLHEMAGNKVAFQDIIYFYAKNKYDQKKYDEAITACSYLIQQKDKLAGVKNRLLVDALFLTAYSHSLKRSFMPALSYYDTLIQIDSSDWLYFNNRGDCLMQMGKINEAIPDFQMAIKMTDGISTPFDVTYPMPWYNMGYCYFRNAAYDTSLYYYYRGSKIFMGYTFWPAFLLLIGLILFPFRKKIKKMWPKS